MSNTAIPRIVVSGLRGGGGKTVLSLSLVALLKNRGYNVITFKKGPDYIDAGWLAKASGSPCYNLDTFMMTPEQAAGSFSDHSENAQIAVIEGNRGLFDGVDHKGTYSTAELAKLLDAPVIIAVDCTKTTNTIAALVLGCQMMDP
ncbi:MAG TPA: cobyrinic acid a,c-diamide synthase, partial [Nitrospirae bacterium]|nr:cobyrinic acid a,c-diamide synthase [Nitrospirota bacterium]